MATLKEFPKQIIKPLVSITENDDGNWNVVLWLPHFDYGLSHDMLDDMPEKDAMRYGRQLRDILKTDLLIER